MNKRQVILGNRKREFGKTEKDLDIQQTKKKLQHYLAAKLIFVCPKAMVISRKPQQEGSLVEYFAFSDREVQKSRKCSTGVKLI